MGQRRYVDVNVFVYWLGRHPKHGERAKKRVFEIENSGRRVYYTSALTLYETLVILGGLLGKRLKDRGDLPVDVNENNLTILVDNIAYLFETNTEKLVLGYYYRRKSIQKRYDGIYDEKSRAKRKTLRKLKERRK